MDAQIAENSSWIPAVAPLPAADRRGQTGSDDHRSGLMTVGQLSRRTGLSPKAIRELEDRGLIYSVGRSEANYRLFDDTALWCVGAIGELRSLGLTLAEIEQLHRLHLEHPDRRIGSQLAQLLDRSQERINARIQALQLTLKRIDAFRTANTELLDGTANPDPAASDPCATHKQAD